MKNNSTKKTYDDYIRDVRSFAGKRGSASRWKDHKKKSTKHVRLYEGDFYILSFLARRFGSIAAAVHHLIIDSGYSHLSIDQARSRAKK